MAHAAAGDNRYIHAVAELIVGLRYERIPTEVLARLRRLDSSGCALHGARLLAVV